MDYKKQIRDLISKGKTKDAIALFYESLTENDSELRNKLTLLGGQLTILSDKINLGGIAQDYANPEYVRISNSTLNFLDDWKQTDSTTILDKLILQLPINKDELGLLSLVNCDRKDPVKKFNESFDEKKNLKQPFQFYFLCGCPTEKPDSLAKRVVYEIIEKEDLDKNPSVSYSSVHSEDGFNLLKVENLIQDDVKNSRKKLKEYVQKRFERPNTESFETFIETGITELSYNYIFSIFKIVETDWEDAEEDIFNYLQWMIDTFKCASPKVPTFLFILVFQFENLYDSEKLSKQNEAIVKNLESFCKKNTTAILKKIEPIKTIHFTDWLDKLGVDNLNYSENLILEFSKKLKDKDKFTINGEPRFHMKDIELLQKKILEAFRNK